MLNNSSKSPCSIQKQTFIIYWIILFIVIFSLILLPFLHTTISVKSPGIIRPISERTLVRSIQAGIIDTLYLKEGQQVIKGEIILRIRDFNYETKVQYNSLELNRINNFVDDLQVLSRAISLSDTTLHRLKTSLYKEQLNRYLNQLNEKQILLTKANKEYELNTQLKVSNVISEKEFFDFENAQQYAQAVYDAFIREQKSNWYHQIEEYQTQLIQLQQNKQLVSEGTKTYEVRAPVSGIIQGINTNYTGGVLQLGETICSISPETEFIAECYVTPKDIGLISPNQPVTFQVEAYNYNVFGVARGKVLSIDNDFTLLDNKNPVFIVRCRFEDSKLLLKNGYTGYLKKGLTFQSRFVIGERNMWQLLWDSMDDWLNPAAPKTHYLQ